MSRNQKVGLILNTAISVFMIIGVLIMFTRKPDDNAMLTSVGIENLKYYTVLSNIFCGIVAVIYIIFACFKKETAVLAGIPTILYGGFFRARTHIQSH